MSLKVLVIPEDYTNDRLILAPLLQRMFAEVGKPNANVQFFTDTSIRGIGDALKWENIKNAIAMYPMVDIFLLIVDRDCVETRHESLRNLENVAQKNLPKTRTLIAEHAWQEIEVWGLAGLDLPSEWRWQDIRAERDPKERYFKPLAASSDLLQGPGEGRATIGKQAALNYNRVRSRCNEDFANLENRIRAWFT